MNRRQLLKTISLALGGMASGSLARAVLAAESTMRAPRGPMFDSVQRQQVETVAELIIPTTDTPGAIAAGVPDFIEMMVGEWYTPKERDIFCQGMQSLDAMAREASCAAFLDATPAQQVEVLRECEQLAMAYQGKAVMTFADIGKIDENAPFFHKLKELVVVGYYTSEVGARQEHKYFRMTRRYDGDYDLARTGGRQWSY